MERVGSSDIVLRKLPIECGPVRLYSHPMTVPVVVGIAVSSLCSIAETGNRCR